MKKDNRVSQQPADAPSSAKPPAGTPPAGYLPTADPPRKNRVLLAIAAALLAVWMLVLTYLALFG